MTRSGASNAAAAARVSNNDRGRYRLDHSKDVKFWEAALHEIEAAPGHVIFVGNRLDGRWQTIQVDPDEVDELCRFLHAAKRHARRSKS
jgi:hypothetical protein